MITNPRMEGGYPVLRQALERSSSGNIHPSFQDGWVFINPSQKILATNDPPTILPRRPGTKTNTEPRMAFSEGRSMVISSVLVVKSGQTLVTNHSREDWPLRQVTLVIWSGKPSQTWRGLAHFCWDFQGDSWAPKGTKIGKLCYIKVNTFFLLDASVHSCVYDLGLMVIFMEIYYDKPW